MIWADKAGFGNVARRPASKRPMPLLRAPSLAMLAAVCSAIPANAAGFRAAAGPRIGPGVYLSASVALSLRPGGVFLVQELGGARQAGGQYSATPGAITFSSGEGDVGKTRFPFTCRIVSAFDGFTVEPGQPGCKPFAGLAFRTVE
jgi:hypothetical protein